MKNFAKLAMLSAVSAVMVVAPLAGASAHDHYWHGPGYWDGPRYWDHHHHHHGHGDAVAAGVVGLAAGALIGSALSQPAQPQVIYQAPPPQPIIRLPRDIISQLVLTIRRHRLPISRSISHGLPVGVVIVPRNTGHSIRVPVPIVALMASTIFAMPTDLKAFII